MLVFISRVNKHALFALSRTVQTVIKVDNASFAQIIVMGLLAISFVHLFAKYAIVKFVTSAHLAITLVQQALVKR